MFTITLDKHADNLERLLNLYFPKRKNVKIIDFTYGTGALEWNVNDTCWCCGQRHFVFTKCDKEPSPKLPDFKEIHVKDLFTDDYSDLGLHDGALFDPPYLIGRDSFDYSAKVSHLGQLIPMQYQGKRSWGANRLEKYVANPTVEHFNRRVKHLNDKAPTVLKESGVLFVKVMNCYYKKHYIAHDVTITNLLTNFELIDKITYIRQGATTWTTKNHAQNLTGYWMVYRVREERLA